MPNTDCLRCCDAVSRTRMIDILGKPVRAKNYICSTDGRNYPEKPEQIQLMMSVCPTCYCPADCPFCIATDTKKRRKLNIEAFAGTMRRLKAEKRIRSVKITGGEPFYDVPLLNEVISVLYEVFGYELELSVSTNGMRLDRIHQIGELTHLDTIHISRHHYDDAINRSLFGGAKVPTGELLKEIVGTVPFRDLFVINCMLLKDYINSPEEARRFLEFAIGTGVPKVGFMTCAPINRFAKEQTVPYESVLREDDPSLLFTRRFCDYEFCHCSDGIYAAPDGRIVEFYGRSTNAGNCDYTRGLVYDADNRLLTGFGGTVIC